MDRKTCGACGESKPLTEFYRRKDRPGGEEYRSDCKECRKAKVLSWRQENPDRCRRYSRTYMRKVRPSLSRKAQELKTAVFRAYGGSCACCGEAEFEFLTLEHINGDGHLHKKSLKGVSFEEGQSWWGNGATALHLKVYLDLKRKGFPREGYCLLCWNCHMATRYGKPCPHRGVFDVAAVG